MSIFFWFPIVSGSRFCSLSIIVSIWFQSLVRKNGKKYSNSLHFINLCLNSSVVPLFSMVKNPSLVFCPCFYFEFQIQFCMVNLLVLSCLLKYDKRSEVWCYVILMKVQYTPPTRFFGNFKCNFISTIF